MFAKFYDEKIKKWATDLCHVLELLVAVIVLAAVLISLIGLVPSMGELWQNRSGSESFLHFLEEAMIIVIGVEFIKMLCRPTADNVLETIIFLVARHMIVINTTTPQDDFVSTVSIILLCLMRRYLKVSREKEKERTLEKQRMLEKEHSGEKI